MALYACGLSQVGQLGIGPVDRKDRPTMLRDMPVPVSGLQAKPLAAVAAGEQHSLALTSLGTVWAWGRGREGQVGQGTRQNQMEAIEITALAKERIVLVACGSYHSVCVSEAGRVFVWGKLHRTIKGDEFSQDLGRLAGQVGLKKEGVDHLVEASIAQYLAGDQDQDELQKELMETFLRYQEYYQTSPSLVLGALQSRRIVKVAAGYCFTVAVTSVGEVFAWGFNDKGQLGLGHRFNQEEPRHVKLLADEFVVDLDCGSSHTVVITKRSLYSWGMGVFGQLGHGSAKDSLVPRPVVGFENFSGEERVVSVSCGTHHSMALRCDGKVFTWGHGEYGQHGGLQNHVDWGTGALGGGEDGDGGDGHFHSQPRPLVGLEEEIAVISAGSLHNCVVTMDGRCFTFGYGANGCLGHGDSRDQIVPREIEALRGRPIDSAACGWKHTLLLQKGTGSSFAYEFLSLVNNPKFADLELVIKEKSIICHKAVVLARCMRLRAVAAMTSRFTDACCESLHRDVLDLSSTGMSYAVLLGLVTYLYTDTVDVAPHQLVRLAKVASSFGLPYLARLCLMQAGMDGSSSEEAESCFARDLREMVASPMYADVAFDLSGSSEAVCAHKAILVRRCAYFERLFEGGFREGGEDEQEDGRQVSRIQLLQAVDPSVFLVVLDWLYCGDSSVITAENVVSLLAASDCLMVDDLKQYCVAMLEESLDVDNACAVLVLGDQYQAPRLSSTTMDFILSSEDCLRQTRLSDGFKFLRTREDLLRSLDYAATKRGMLAAGDVFKPLEL